MRQLLLLKLRSRLVSLLLLGLASGWIPPSATATALPISLGQGSSIDRDNDQDLVIASAISGQPITVWLSSGHGHFERGDHRLGAGFLVSNNPDIYEYDSIRRDEATSNQDETLWWNRSTIIGAEMEIGGLARRNWHEPSLQLRAYKLPVRSPPSAPLLSRNTRQVLVKT